MPIEFGHKTSWIAVSSDNSEEVAKTYGLKKMVKCNWKDGIESKDIFVSPPVDNWVLIINIYGGLDFVVRKIENLSKRHGEAQFFGSYGTVAYAKAENGKRHD